MEKHAKATKIDLKFIFSSNNIISMNHPGSYLPRPSFWSGYASNCHACKRVYHLSYELETNLELPKNNNWHDLMLNGKNVLISGQIQLAWVHISFSSFRLGLCCVVVSYVRQREIYIRRIIYTMVCVRLFRPIFPLSLFGSYICMKLALYPCTQGPETCNVIPAGVHHGEWEFIAAIFSFVVISAFLFWYVWLKM